MLFLRRLIYLFNRLLNDGAYFVRSVLTIFRLRYRYRLADLVKKNQKHVVIFTLGKCGSTSVQFSLCKGWKTSNIHQVHFLSKRSLSSLDTRQFSALHLRARKVDKLLDRINPKNVTFISIIRNPFDRDVSSYFQNRDWYKKFDPGLENFEAYLKNNGSMSLNWIYDELQHYFQLDDISIDKISNEGTWLDLNSGSRLLLMRFENLEDSLKTNFPGVELLQINSADQKKYGQEKRELLDQIEYPLDYVERVKTSRFYKTYYS
jgi:hypothetical protein